MSSLRADNFAKFSTTDLCRLTENSTRQNQMNFPAFSTYFPVKSSCCPLAERGLTKLAQSKSHYLALKQKSPPSFEAKVTT
jgi:hypothetical protein